MKLAQNCQSYISSIRAAVAARRQGRSQSIGSTRSIQVHPTRKGSAVMMLLCHMHACTHAWVAANNLPRSHGRHNDRHAVECVPSVWNGLSSSARCVRLLCRWGPLDRASRAHAQPRLATMHELAARDSQSIEIGRARFFLVCSGPCIMPCESGLRPVRTRMPDGVPVGLRVSRSSALNLNSVRYSPRAHALHGRGVGWVAR